MVLMLIDTHDLSVAIERSLKERLRFHESRGFGPVSYKDDLGAHTFACLISHDLAFDDEFQKRFPAARSIEDVVR